MSVDAGGIILPIAAIGLIVALVLLFVMRVLFSWLLSTADILKELKALNEKTDSVVLSEILKELKMLNAKTDNVASSLYETRLILLRTERQTPTPPR